MIPVMVRNKSVASIGKGCLSARSNTDALRRLQRSRPKRRQLLCPAHPDQRLVGTGRKYYLHLLKSEELMARGMSDKTARVVMQAYPVLVMSNEWLEELFCPECGSSRWCHVTRGDTDCLSVSWAKPELWQQVAHVDPLLPSPSVSEYSRRQARRLTHRRIDGMQFFDRT
jgi:hypothetical protein